MGSAFGFATKRNSRSRISRKSKGAEKDSTYVSSTLFTLFDSHETFKIPGTIVLMCRRVPESTPIQVLCAMAMDRSTRYDTQKVKKHLLDEHFLIDVWLLGKHLNLRRVFRDILGENQSVEKISKEEERAKKPFAKSAFFRFGSDGKKKKKKTKKQISSKSLRLRSSKSPSRKNMRLADMLEQEVSKVGERDKLEATRGEVLAIQSGRRSKGSSPVIRHRNGLPEVELEHPLLMEEWQREYLYGF